MWWVVVVVVVWCVGCGVWGGKGTTGLSVEGAARVRVVASGGEGRGA